MIPTAYAVAKANQRVRYHRQKKQDKFKLMKKKPKEEKDAKKEFEKPLKRIQRQTQEGKTTGAASERKRIRRNQLKTCRKLQKGNVINIRSDIKDQRSNKMEKQKKNRIRTGKHGYTSHADIKSHYKEKLRINLC